MFKKFGEFDNVAELNKKAEGLLTAGDGDGIRELAKENGIDADDAQDFIEGTVSDLATPLTAAAGKINIEAEELGIGGILLDWKQAVLQCCVDDIQMAKAVRRKGMRLAECMAKMIAFSFENKVQVPDAIVDITKVNHNGKKEPCHKPLYLGVPNRAEARKIIREYYLGVSE